MIHGISNFLRWARGGLLLCAFCAGFVLAVNAQEWQLESDSFTVFVENQRDDGHTYEVKFWPGTPDDEPETPDSAGVQEIGSESTWPFTFVVPTGEIAPEGSYPNLCTFAVFRDGVKFAANAFPYRFDEETHAFVPNESFKEAVVTDEADPIPGSGMTLAEFITTNTETVNAFVWNEYQNMPSQAETTEVKAAEQRLAAEAAVTAVNTPNLGSPEESTDTSPLTFTLPGLGNGGGIAVSFDPMDHEGIADVIPWIKNLITWFMLLVWAWWAWNLFGKTMSEVGSAQQAKGNPVLGGTGAQATAILAAVAIGLIIVAVPAAWWALVTVNLTPLEDNPLTKSSDVVDAALYLLGLTWDYPLAIYLISAAFAVLKGKIVIVTGIQAAVRAIVP